VTILGASFGNRWCRDSLEREGMRLGGQARQIPDFKTTRSRLLSEENKITKTKKKGAIVFIIYMYM